MESPECRMTWSYHHNLLTSIFFYKNEIYKFINSSSLVRNPFKELPMQSQILIMSIMILQKWILNTCLTQSNLVLHGNADDNLIRWWNGAYCKLFQLFSNHIKYDDSKTKSCIHFFSEIENNNALIEHEFQIFLNIKIKEEDRCYGFCLLTYIYKPDCK